MATATTIRCKWESGEIVLGMDEAGSRSSVVFLPALSSISTRAEMRPLFDLLAPQFRVSSVDWPGFGDRARSRDDWSPEILSAFLNWFLSEIGSPPHAVVAAGHAASYALYQAVYQPGTIDRLVLIAPTWRGPLPTMMGGQRPWFARIRAAVDLPGLGPILYRLNVSRPIVTKMAKEHVYSDPDWLRGDRLAAKLAITRAPGARHASVRFVTGGLDRVASRAAFLDLARRTDVPMLVVYGDQTPPKSRAEMEALAELPNLQVKRLAKGKLAIHEEFPEAVVAAIRPFLNR
jgi:pimeloyl-ACP methyl ester carboxylesterase